MGGAGKSKIAMSNLVTAILVWGIFGNVLLALAYRRASEKIKPQFVWIIPLLNSLVVIIVFRYFGNTWTLAVVAAIATGIMGVQAYRVIRQIP
jgi:hypothetical protein